MATHPKIKIRAVKTLTGYSIPRESFPEAASQNWKEGALVVVTGGYLVECGADPALVMGVAVGPGKNNPTAGVMKNECELAHPDTLFIGNLSATGAEDTTVGAPTDLGASYGLTKHTTDGRWYVDKTKTTTAGRVIVWKLYDEIIPSSSGSAARPQWTDTIPIVVFSFKTANYQGAA